MESSRELSQLELILVEVEVEDEVLIKLTVESSFHLINSLEKVEAER